MNEIVIFFVKFIRLVILEATVLYLGRPGYAAETTDMFYVWLVNNMIESVFFDVPR